MGLNCNVVDMQGQQCLVIDGDSAANMFYATAKLHNAALDVGADRSVSWESRDTRYELTHIGEVPRLTLTLKG